MSLPLAAPTAPLQQNPVLDATVALASHDARTVVRVMRGDLALNPIVMKTACDAVRGHTVNEFVDAGGLPLLVALLNGPLAGNGSVLVAACGAVAAITAMPLNSETFADAGGLATLKTVLDTAWENEFGDVWIDDVRTAVFKAVAVATASTRVAARFVIDADGLGALYRRFVSCIRPPPHSERPPMSPMVVLAACEAVRSVIRSTTTSQEAFVGLGGLTILVELLRGTHRGDVGIMHMACELTFIATGMPDHRDAFRAAGGVAPLRSACAFSRSPRQEALKLRFGVAGWMGWRWRE